RVKCLACDFCDDFSAGYADISFGGTGAPSGWTTAITRTQIGKAVFNDALKNKLETYRVDDNPQYITLAEKKIKIMSELKKQRADYSKTSLENAGIKVIG
ncbi:MAG: Coenzyme F420 hydrogenase/dehydrogenase, beta subunit C-terminal domain, partial [Proteobacteria bacterium]|nr:Coenzyme F420 hydrogenase/dehydrogenase, beta subunit C-terminal domain [Pseudomonadota bacterium]